MTREEVAAMIQSIGLPFAYYQFDDTAQEPPYICFYYPESDDFVADNSNYVRIEVLTIELYTKDKRFDLEEQIESKLAENEIVFSKIETHDDAEKLVLTSYESEVIING